MKITGVGGHLLEKSRGDREALLRTAPGDNIPSESYDDGILWRGMRCGESSKISSWRSTEPHSRTVVYDCVGTKRPTVNLGVWGGHVGCRGSQATRKALFRAQVPETPGLNSSISLPSL